MRRLPLAVPALLLACLTLLAPAVRSQVLPTGFTDQQIAASLAFPVGFDFLPDGRVLIVEQASARVRMVEGLALSPVDPVITVPEVRSGSERGLLGIAVDPRWPAQPYFYVHSTSTTGRIRISRFRAAGDLTGTSGAGLTADPASRFELLDDIPDAQFNHNGGTVRFGPDSLLYVSLGEDATPCAAQDTVSLRGVILRLEVRGLPDGPGAATRSQLVAAGNPLSAHPDSNARLVAASGLRNPFRFQVDPVRRWLIIGDVGQTAFEEIDVLRLPGGSGTAGGALGSDFGWPWFEGPAAFSTCSGTGAGRIGPSYAYDRTGSNSASVISGGAYWPKGAASDWPAAYHGDVFMSDYYSGVLRRLRASGSALDLAPAVPGQPSAVAWATGFQAVADYRVGPDGSLWYLRQAVNFQNNTGSLRRLLSVGGPPPPVPGPFDYSLRISPQPAPGAATISFTPTGESRLTLRVLDISGRTIRTLLEDSDRAAARYDVTWDGRDDAGTRVPSGLYLVRAQAGGLVRTQRLMMIR